MSHPLKLRPHRITLSGGKSFALNLPEGFDITVAAEGLKRVRFMAKSPDNRIFVTDMYNRTDNKRGAVYILDDFNLKAGKFGKVTKWLGNLRNPNSLTFYTDSGGTHWLYLALTDRLVRYKYTLGESAPSSEPETLVTFPDYGLNYKYGGWHLTRTVVVGGNGKIYVSVGSSCNACEETEAVRASVLEMEPDGKNQRVFAHGLRNAVGLKLVGDRLFATNMGADHLGDNKPDDTMYVVGEKANYGWPYYYLFRSKLFADEKFAASTKRPDRNQVPLPFASFLAHSSPLGLEYFSNDAPDELKESFLVALHGSGFVRIGHGYSVARVRKGAPPQDFITGFLQNRKINGRPVDVMKFGDGFLLTDDYAGVVYYVFRAR
ncbi:MAG TPA: PQQ-dependent sugar dehydrogenase [Blastocatellia bacterium]|nr:PQQ-dependent sugar dehydrogenase [Blastocatellia bacterium]